MTEAVNKPYDMRIDLPKDQHFPLAVAHLCMNNFSGPIFVQGLGFPSSPCQHNPVLSPQPQFIKTMEQHHYMNSDCHWCCKEKMIYFLVAHVLHITNVGFHRQVQDGSRRWEEELTVFVPAQ